MPNSTSTFEQDAVVVLSAGEYEQRMIHAVVTMTHGGDFKTLMAEFVAQAKEPDEFSFNLWLVDQGHARLLAAFDVDFFFDRHKQWADVRQLTLK